MVDPYAPPQPYAPDFSEADPVVWPRRDGMSVFTPVWDPKSRRYLNDIGLRGGLENKARKERLAKGNGKRIDYIINAAEIPITMAKGLVGMPEALWSGATVVGDTLTGKYNPTPTMDWEDSGAKIYEQALKEDELPNRAMDLAGLATMGGGLAHGISKPKLPISALGAPKPYRQVPEFFSNPKEAAPVAALSMDLASREARRVEQGYTTPAYHGTFEGDISEFHPDSHFGSPDAANDILEFGESWKDPGNQGSVYPVWLRGEYIKTRDLGFDIEDPTWKDSDIKKYLFGKGVIDPETGEKKSYVKDFGDEEPLEPLTPEEKKLPIKEVLKNRGYSGLEYINEHEDIGSTSHLVFEPRDIRSKAAAFDPTKKNLGNILYSGSDKKAGVVALAAGQKKEPLFSLAERTVDESGLKAATGSQWRATLANKGVKPDELANIEEWLSQNAERKIPQSEIKEKVRETTPQFEEKWKKSPESLTPEERENPPGYTKFHQYQVPGGENYRELVLTLPKGNVSPELLDKSAKSLFGKGYKELDIFNQSIVDDHVSQTFHDTTYRSSHWDEPNPLAHVRMNDRTLQSAEGTPQRTLFLEELQSDWHQAGRKEGYKGQIPDDIAKIADKIAGHKTTATTIDHSELGRAFQEGRITQPEWETFSNWKGQPGSSMSAVPDAPFKKTWSELLLKRMVREASENSYDQIAWTDGATQADRYDLSKHVDSVDYDPKYGILRGMKDGSQIVFREEGVKPEKLADYIGKDAAEKLLESQVKEIYPPGVGNIGHEISGVDLKLGGEGMRGFYDQMLPRMANKLFGRWGAKVRQETLTEPLFNQFEDAWTFLQRKGLNANTGLNLRSAYKTPKQRQGLVLKAQELGFDITSQQHTIHVLPITPELRQQALQHGFALYAGGKKSIAVGAAAATLGKKSKTFLPGEDVPDYVHWDTAPKSTEEWAAVPGQVKIKEPPFIKDSDLALATGVVIREPDGSVWVMHPKGQYGGYKATFPKGRLEKGLSPQANAIKEAFEETGLQVKIIGHLQDVDKTTTRTRYYLAERVGGTPKSMGPESEAVSMVHPDELSGIVDHPSDAPLISRLQTAAAPKPGQKLKPYPLEKMREYTPEEFPWEWREYDKYARSKYPGLFKDQADFRAKYDAAPLVHLPESVIKGMDYATAGGYFNVGKEQGLQALQHHRDVGRIQGQIDEGKVAPPIVIQTDQGYRILGGNTRMAIGAAQGLNIPVKLIDTRKPLALPPPRKDYKSEYPGGEPYERFLKKYPEHHDQLTKDDLKAIIGYSDGHYKPIANHIYKSESLFKNYSWTLQKLDEMFERASLPTNLVLWRGVSYDVGGDIAKLQPGDFYTPAGYQSTSLSRGVAKGWKPVLIKITMPRGSKALVLGHLSANPGENEVLLPRNLPLFYQGRDAYGVPNFAPAGEAKPVPLTAGSVGTKVQPSNEPLSGQKLADQINKLISKLISAKKFLKEQGTLVEEWSTPEQIIGQAKSYGWKPPSKATDDITSAKEFLMENGVLSAKDDLVLTQAKAHGWKPPSKDLSSAVKKGLPHTTNSLEELRDWLEYYSDYSKDEIMKMSPAFLRATAKSEGYDDFMAQVTQTKDFGGYNYSPDDLDSAKKFLKEHKEAGYGPPWPTTKYLIQDAEQLGWVAPGKTKDFGDLPTKLAEHPDNIDTAGKWLVNEGYLLPSALKSYYPKDIVSKALNHGWQPKTVKPDSAKLAENIKTAEAYEWLLDNTDSSVASLEGTTNLDIVQKALNHGWQPKTVKPVNNALHQVDDALNWLKTMHFDTAQLYDDKQIVTKALSAGWKPDGNSSSIEQALTSSGFKKPPDAGKVGFQNHWFNEESGSSVFLGPDGKWNVIKNGAHMGDGQGLDALKKYIGPKTGGSDVKINIEKALMESGYEKTGETGYSNDQWWNAATDSSVFLEKDGNWSAVKGGDHVGKGWGLQALQPHIGKVSTPAQNSAQVTKNIKKSLEEAGWKNDGGGDNFDTWSKPGLLKKYVYTYDNGNWEFHDLNKQKTDAPENATGKGWGLQALQSHLSESAPVWKPTTTYPPDVELVAEDLGTEWGVVNKKNGEIYNDNLTEVEAKKIVADHSGKEATPKQYVVEGNGPWAVYNSETGKFQQDFNKKEAAVAYAKELNKKALSNPSDTPYTGPTEYEN